MFPDSKIAEQFQCGRTKAGYLAAFGIAPFLTDQLGKVVKNLTFYTLLFDESFNAELQSKQMDVHIRFLECESGLVQTRYFTSFFMGHAKAVDIERNIKDAVSKLGNENLLQISMDGPNVNLKVYKDIASELDRNHLRQLLNIGTCGLHVLYNAFKDGMKATGWDISSLLKSVFYLFQESPARHEDYFQITGSTTLPLQFCGHRWLENKGTAERLLKILPLVQIYVKACKDGKAAEPMCKSFKIICDLIADKLLTVKLHCFVHICKILQPFLEKYQSNDPLASFLATDLLKVVKRLYSFILKEDSPTLTLDHDLNPAKMNKDYFRSHNNLRLGTDADEALRALIKLKTVSEKDVMAVRLDLKKMCTSIITKIVDKSPIAHKLAKALTCLNPDKITEADTSSKFNCLVKHLHANRWLSGDEVDDSIFEFSTLREMNVKRDGEERLDMFYQKMDFTNMPALRKVINIVLTLSHGNAEVERGFSVNKEVMIENMGEKTVIAKRLICQYVKENGGHPAKIPLSKALLTSCSGAYRRYKTALEEEKKLKEVDEKTLVRKRKAEELREMNSKKRKIELNVDLLLRKADDMAEEAETCNSKKAMELLVQSNALRKDAKTKKMEIEEVRACIQTLECELDS